MMPFKLLIIIIDCVACFYLYRIFKVKQSLIFFLHPLLLILGSATYERSFLELGDGPSHLKVFEHYVSLFPLSLEKITVFDQYFFTNLRQQHLAVIPVLVLANYIYQPLNAEITYLVQGVLGTLYSTLWIVLAKKWNITTRRYLLYMALFVVLSPSFFELRNNLNRYDVLAFGVILFYVSFVAINNKMSAGRALALSFSVVMIIVSKYIMLLPVLLFCIYYYTIERKKYKLFIIIVMIVAVATLPFATNISDYFEKYIQIASTGGGRFGFLANIFILGMGFKVIFALVSPFPWHSPQMIVEGVYGGNYFTFVMHVFSALIAVHLFIILLTRFRVILCSKNIVRLPVIYGLFFSTSIIFGAAGYHFYILIFFPFFIHLVAVGRLHVPIFWAFSFVFLLQVSYTIAVLALNYLN